MTIPTKAEAWAVRARELMILSAKELEDAHHDIEKLKKSLSKEVTESERLRAERDALREALALARTVLVVACGEKAPYIKIALERIDAALAAQEKP